MISPLVWKVLSAILASLVTVRITSGLVAYNAANKLERPKYEVLERLGGGVEVRRYESYVVAEATMSPEGSSMRAASGNGFRACAGYIFGKKNRQQRTFAMTAPVRMTSRAEAVKVSFVMARNESLRTLPVPTDANVKLKAIPAHVAAFARFSGRPPRESVVERKRRLVETKLGTSRFRPLRDADTLVYGYHDPFLTPNLLRRNEVGFFVDPKP
ncbi:hypothetical protein CTAYLR_006334 [Chrysophaeum taylorii]|uniref:SOUL heme-binding protein n=1 Tax=Chrysophaeum taylorii TaxID=2483200 RepID=A0AAD7UBL5_9STRA|nr:hypothetical protein CTAYLR_006334 [Chrysophaeum taylorii]